jgi:hypothetical protein
MANLDKLVKAYEEITHDKANSQVKKLSIIESGIVDEGAINFLMKLKNGPLTKMQITLDNQDESDTVITLRLLSTAETILIDEEIANCTFATPWIAAKMRIAKTLSCATKDYCSSEKNYSTPKYSEKEFLYLTPRVLNWLNIKYDQFIEKYSPRPEDLTDEDLTNIVKSLDKLDESGVLSGTPMEEVERKKLDLLTLLDFTTMSETLIFMHNQLKTIKEQTAQLLMP